MTDRQRDLIDLVRALGILQVIVFHVVIGIVAYADPAGLPQVIDRLPHAMSVFFQAMGVDLIFMTSTVLIGMAIHAEIAAGRGAFLDCREGVDSAWTITCTPPGGERCSPAGMCRSVRWPSRTDSPVSATKVMP